MRIHATHILLVPKLEIFYLVKLNKRSQKKEITKDGIAQHYVYCRDESNEPSFGFVIVWNGNLSEFYRKTQGIISYYICWPDATLTGQTFILSIYFTLLKASTSGKISQHWRLWLSMDPSFTKNMTKILKLNHIT